MSSRAALKSELRQRMRHWRRQLSHAEQARAARQLARQCAALPGWSRARRIGLYHAVDGEIGTAALAQAAHDSGKTAYLPVVDGNLLRFARWDSEDSLTANRYGIGEPPTDVERIVATDLDILCLPVVAWDRSGARLGMGGGFYDRTLAQPPRPLLVGLAHSGQELTSLPRDEWDVAMDWVVTETGCLRCPGG